MTVREELESINLNGKTPRPYQVDAVIEARDNICRGITSQIFLSPTGAGKTFTACMLIKRAVDKFKYVTFLAPKRELVRQCSRHLHEFGIQHSLIMAGKKELYDKTYRVQVATKDTLAARTIRKNRMRFPASHLVIMDECHLTLSREWTLLIEKFKEAAPEVVFIGLTATAARGDGQDLGKNFQKIVRVSSYAELIRDGYLVPTRAFSPTIPDMKGVDIGSDGDWVKDQVQKRMAVPKLIGDVYDHWKSLGSDRQTIIFASGVAHSIALAQEFAKHGVRAEHIDGETNPDTRAAILKDLASGDTQVVSNVDCISEGFDCPPVSCIVLAAPSRSIVKYRQRAGRALRPHTFMDGTIKKDCLLIDHAGAVLQHGFPDEDIEWVLGNGVNACKHQRELREGGEIPERVCPKCFCTWKGDSQCPNCGWATRKNGKQIAVRNGLLKEVKRKDVKKNGKATKTEFQQYWQMCIGVAANTGRTCGAAAAMFIKRHRKKPWQVGVKNLPSNAEWKKKASDVYPNYVRRPKVESMEDEW